MVLVGVYFKATYLLYCTVLTVSRTLGNDSTCLLNILLTVQYCRDFYFSLPFLEDGMSGWVLEELY